MPPQKENILLIVCLTIGVLMFVMGYFIYTLILNQRRIARWKKAQVEAEIKTLENDRKRIASDLHDELGPLLSAVKLQINHIEPSDEVEQIVLSKSNKQIDEIVKRFREISFNLMPNTLTRKSLMAAINEYIEKKSYNYEVIFSPANEPFSLSNESEINIYRIIQEIMHNTHKHSRATCLHISFINKKENLILHTKDNGIGFNYNEKKQEQLGIGLLSLQSRVDMLGANMEVKSDLGKGVEYIITIPLIKNNDKQKNH